MSANNFAKVDGGFQAQQQVVEGAVPAQLLIELAAKFYQDRDADRLLAKEILVQMMNLGATAIELARAEAQERQDERAERQRAERRREADERQRNARRS
jgi:hypothetical protein